VLLKKNVHSTTWLSQLTFVSITDAAIVGSSLYLHQPN